MKKEKQLRVCLECGAHFRGSNDRHYCPDCAKKKKLETVVKIRICQDCGSEFSGGPRAKRCPNCANIAEKTARKMRGNKPAARPLGSIDKCKICGKDYVVKSGRQMYCPDCARDAVLAWQRDHKKDYNKKSGQDVKKRIRRADQEKVCVYCLRHFKANVSTNLCSDFCRIEHKKLQQCEADIKRGRNRNLQKYLDKRQKYRDSVNGQK